MSEETKTIEAEDRVTMTLRISTDPTEVRVLEYGENPCRLRDPITLDMEVADNLVAKQKESVRISRDFSADTTLGFGLLEARTDGLWAVNIRWNEDADPVGRGASYLAPFVVLQDGAVTDVRGLAITETPILVNSVPLKPREIQPFERKMFDMRISRMVQQGWRIDERTEFDVLLSAPKNLQPHVVTPTAVSNEPESLEKSASEAIRWAYKCSLELRAKWAALIAERLSDPLVGAWQDLDDEPRQKLFEAVIEGSFKDAAGAELAPLIVTKIARLFLARVMARRAPLRAEKSEG